MSERLSQDLASLRIDRAERYPVSIRWGLRSRSKRSATEGRDASCNFPPRTPLHVGVRQRTRAHAHAAGFLAETPALATSQSTQGLDDLCVAHFALLPFHRVAVDCRPPSAESSYGATLFIGNGGGRKYSRGRIDGAQQQV